MSENRVKVDAFVSLCAVCFTTNDLVENANRKIAIYLSRGHNLWQDNIGHCWILFGVTATQFYNAKRNTNRTTNVICPLVRFEIANARRRLQWAQEEEKTKKATT